MINRFGGDRMADVMWPVEMYKEIPEANRFQQSQVIMPSGGYNYGSSFANTFNNVMQQQQEQKAAQQQMQAYAQSTQSLVPTLKNMGYSIDQINSLFQLNPKALIQQGMEEYQFGAHQKQELAKTQKMHDMEIEWNKLTTDQLHNVDLFKAGKMSWDDLVQNIPSDKLGKAFELSEKGLNLTKAAQLLPLELTEKKLITEARALQNKYLEPKIQQDLYDKSERLRIAKANLQNASTRIDLDKASQDLKKAEFEYRKVHDSIIEEDKKNKPGSQGTKLLKNGLTEQNTKLYNTIASFNDGSLDSAQKMYQEARKAGLRLPAPEPLTDGSKYIKIIRGLLQNKSIDDSKSQVQQLQDKKANIDKQIQSGKSTVQQLSDIEKQLANPKTTDAQADKLMTQARSITTNAGPQLNGKFFQESLAQLKNVPGDKLQEAKSRIDQAYKAGKLTKLQYDTLLSSMRTGSY